MLVGCFRSQVIHRSTVTEMTVYEQPRLLERIQSAVDGRLIGPRPGFPLDLVEYRCSRQVFAVTPSHHRTDRTPGVGDSQTLVAECVDERLGVDVHRHLP